MNMNLRELYLADNKLNGLQDSAQLGNLLKFNCSLQILDLRNNHVLDSGVCTLDSWGYSGGQDNPRPSPGREFRLGRAGLPDHQSEGQGGHPGGRDGFNGDLQDDVRSMEQIIIITTSC